MYIAINHKNTPPAYDWQCNNCFVKGLDEKNVTYRESEDTLYGIIGWIYDKSEDVATAYRRYQKGGYQLLSEIDGDFIYFEIHRDGCCCVVSDREGDIPVYYREDKEQGIIISTECSELFYDFSLTTLRESAVNDFLRFGTLVGDETMHKDVHLLQGGSELRFSTNKGLSKKRHYRFHYEESVISRGEIEEKVYNSYVKGVAKRLEGKETETCIFLSGGMDSRLLLAVANNITGNKVGAVTFGQKYSDEVDVARLCANVRGNDFQWIQTAPSDFVVNAEEYIRKVCCGDMFPQSYIIKAAQQINKQAFATGFALDAYMGGTFLNQEALKATSTLSEFLKDHFSLLKMNVLTKAELQELSRDNLARFLDVDNETVLREAKEWDGYSVKDAIQAFGIDNRAKRCVALRETTPGRYLQRINPSSDRDFLNAVSKIPSSYRINHQFYHSMFMRYASEYATIPYNNTTLPVSAPVELWKQGSANELNRENLYAQFMQQHNAVHEEKLYYPHYYSDFDGYSRYDKKWKQLFERYLLNPDAVIVNLWFDRHKLARLYQDHLKGKCNNRKKLIFLTSIEIFLRSKLN